MAIWDPPGATERIHYPLIVKNVEITLDSRSMGLNVTPTEREPSLALDPYFELKLGDPQAVHDTGKTALDHADTTVTPFDVGSYEQLLRSATSRLDPHGEYWPETLTDSADRTLPAPADCLRVTDTWVLFARKRNTNFIAADVERLKQRVEQGIEIPEAAQLIVTEPPDEVVERERRHYRGVSDPGGSSSDVQDLFFPKPFNDSQVSIVERLDQAPGVVVQGPPGTGKTHTIANIICHYLANGKRILVTAQHEAPLTVLREQIPEPLRDLTISLLTSEREGLKQIERSVRQISSQINRIEPSSVQGTIRNLEREIDEAHQAISHNDHRLREIGLPQAARVDYLGEKLTPMELAQRSLEEQDEHAWFQDRPAVAVKDLDLSEADISGLREARTRAGDDLPYLGDDPIPQSDIPSSEAIKRLHADLGRRSAIERAIRIRKVAAVKRTESTQAVLTQTIQLVDQASSLSILRSPGKPTFVMTSERMTLAKRRRRSSLTWKTGRRR